MIRKQVRWTGLGIAALAVTTGAAIALAPTASTTVTNADLTISGDVGGAFYTGQTYTLTALTKASGNPACFSYNTPDMPSYSWTIIGCPSGAGDAPNAVAAIQWTPTAPGQYTLHAVVTDRSVPVIGAGWTDGPVTVTVLAGATTPPTTTPPATTTTPSTTTAPPSTTEPKPASGSFG
ncbi:hypothetical protein [Nocardia acidivorans]|uniref:hypothetical protein n=1 Tax=Nocardia acidivorans TaxID=404580 RepID=UPI0008341415|nr:hypothetical protein [Nocardia acidivorans]